MSTVNTAPTSSRPSLRRRGLGLLIVALALGAFGCKKDNRFVIDTDMQGANDCVLSMSEKCLVELFNAQLNPRKSLSSAEGTSLPPFEVYDSPESGIEALVALTDVGGGTKLPMIRQLTFHFFPDSKNYKPFKGKTHRGVDGSSTIEDVKQRHFAVHEPKRDTWNPVPAPPGVREETLFARNGISFTFWDQRLAYIRVSDPFLSLGMSVQQVQAQTEGTFDIYGFEIDGYMAGTVASWGGSIPAGRMPDFAQFRLANRDALSDSEYMSLAGGPFPSDHPSFLKGGLEVVRLEPLPCSDCE